MPQGRQKEKQSSEKVWSLTLSVLGEDHYSNSTQGLLEEMEKAGGFFASYLPVELQLILDGTRMVQGWYKESMRT